MKKYVLLTIVSTLFPVALPASEMPDQTTPNCRVGTIWDIGVAKKAIFLALNGKNAGRADRLWYNAGISYAIGPHNKIELKAREEQTLLSAPRQWNTFICFAYKIAL